MSGWGLLFRLSVGATGALVFLSIIADDVHRALVDLADRKEAYDRQARTQREEREASADHAWPPGDIVPAHTPEAKFHTPTPDPDMSAQDGSEPA